MMQYYYEDIPGLGNVALSRHAQTKAEQDQITDRHVETVLYRGIDTPVIRSGVSIMASFTGAKLVKTMYRVKPQAMAR